MFIYQKMAVIALALIMGGAGLALAEERTQAGNVILPYPACGAEIEVQPLTGYTLTAPDGDADLDIIFYAQGPAPGVRGSVVGGSLSAGDEEGTVPLDAVSGCVMKFTWVFTPVGVNPRYVYVDGLEGGP